MDVEAKKRWLRRHLSVGTKDLSTKDINSFFKKVDSIKRKYR